MVANTVIILKMLNKLYPKAKYVWQLTGMRTAIENKDKLENVLGQRVIVTKYYANISQVRTCNKGLIKTMCRLLNRHNNVTQR